MAKMTEARRKALAILDNHGPVTAGQFARMMWPDSPGWSRPIGCGPKGSHKGRGMYLSAGCYLNKLKNDGLADFVIRSLFHVQYTWVITSQGRRLLKEEGVHGS